MKLTRRIKQVQKEMGGWEKISEKIYNQLQTSKSYMSKHNLDM